ncbi:hypothetical protein SNEBB_002050 [Seison nebaliae]|nr:hypothetical protein SNEBB_002050 [Seison nebaliae]
MENEPFFSKTELFWLDTGNIISPSRLKKNITRTVEEEAFSALKESLFQWMMKNNPRDVQEEPIIDCSPDVPPEEMTDEERKKRKISVKIFLTSYDTMTLERAIDLVLKKLNMKYIDNFIISLPSPFELNEDTFLEEIDFLPTSEKTKLNGFNKNTNSQPCPGLENVPMNSDLEADGLTVEQLQPLWTVIERYMTNDKIRNGGVCDLSLKLLSDLCESPLTNMIPSSNNLSLHYCCNIDPDLEEYCKEKDIFIFTHSDPRQIIKEKSLRNLLELTFDQVQKKRFSANLSKKRSDTHQMKILDEEDDEEEDEESEEKEDFNKSTTQISQNEKKSGKKLKKPAKIDFTKFTKFSFKPLFVIRYSYILKCRGMIEKKGYIMAAKRYYPKKETSSHHAAWAMDEPIAIH